MRRLAWTCALVLSSAWCAAGPALALTSRDVVIQFRMPSGNIGCVYANFPTVSLRCDILSKIRPLPPRPASCNPDYGAWGYAYSMARHGRAVAICVSDTAIDPRAKVLAYGSTWKHGVFRCQSSTAGLRCTNADGHGFFLSRQHSYRF
jgi:hypothetical protein